MCLSIIGVGDGTTSEATASPCFAPSLQGNQSSNENNRKPCYKYCRTIVSLSNKLVVDLGVHDCHKTLHGQTSNEVDTLINQSISLELSFHKE